MDVVEFPLFADIQFGLAHLAPNDGFSVGCIRVNEVHLASACDEADRVLEPYKVVAHVLQVWHDPAGPEWHCFASGAAEEVADEFRTSSNVRVLV